MRALEAGKHTFIEKPMAASVTECKALVSTARERGLTLMVGHTFLYSSPVRMIKEIIDSGELGELLYVSSRRLNLGLFQKDINVAWDLAPHDISIILHVLGQAPSTVACQGKAGIAKGLEHVTNMTLNFANGVFAMVQSSWLDPNKVRETTFVGTRKMLVYDDIEPMEKIKIYDKRVEAPPHYDTFAEFQYSYHYGDLHVPYIKQVEPLRVECQHFVDSIRQGDFSPFGRRARYGSRAGARGGVGISEVRRWIHFGGPRFDGRCGRSHFAGRGQPDQRRNRREARSKLISPTAPPRGPCRASRGRRCGPASPGSARSAGRLRPRNGKTGSEGHAVHSWASSSSFETRPSTHSAISACVWPPCFSRQSTRIASPSKTMACGRRCRSRFKRCSLSSAWACAKPPCASQKTAKRSNRLKHLVGTTMLVVLISGVLVSALATAFMLPVFRSILHRPDVLELVALTSLAALAQGLCITLMSFYRSSNHAGRYMAAGLGGALLLFVTTTVALFGLKLGIRGALWSYAITYTVVFFVTGADIVRQTGIAVSPKIGALAPALRGTHGLFAGRALCGGGRQLVSPELPRRPRSGRHLLSGR